MEYGNNMRSVWQVTFVGAVVGLLLVLTAVIAITVKDGWANTRIWGFPLLFLGPVVFIVLPVAVTAAFRIRVEEGRVKYLFLGKVLKNYAVADFVGMDGLPPILRFRDGKKISTMGMHLDEIARLAVDLAALSGRSSPSEPREHMP